MIYFNKWVNLSRIFLSRISKNYKSNSVCEIKSTFAQRLHALFSIFSIIYLFIYYTHLLVLLLCLLYTCAQTYKRTQHNTQSISQDCWVEQSQQTWKKNYFISFQNYLFQSFSPFCSSFSFSSSFSYVCNFSLLCIRNNLKFKSPRFL
jgi:hypothetical protein